MSGTTTGALSPTVAAAPSTTEVATSMLAMMAALTGQVTDYNVGSQVRTFAEADGLVVEQQAIADTALAFQALVYSAMSLFGVTQTVALPATGVVTFATSLPVSSAPTSSLSIAIPSGTLVQTNGGVQFATTVASVLPSGATNVNIGVVATAGGALGNVGSGAIAGTPLTSIGYPLYVTNAAPTAGGADPGNQTQALARFSSKVAALGLASPVAVANSSIGVTATGTGETVQKAAITEGWLLAGSGAGSGTAGFTLYIDNGTGGASSSLLAAVQAWISGNVTAGQSGYRPVGVPYTVAAVTPVYAGVAVTGVLTPGLLTTGSVVTSVTNGVQGYFSDLGVSPDAAYQPQVAARASDAGLGAWSSLIVNLFYSSAPGTPVALVSGGVGTRVILQSLTTNISVGT